MRILRTAFSLLTALLLTACASTTIRSAWFDTSYQGGPLKKIVVVGVGGQAVDRRVFEDAFAQQLRAAGVDASPGYTLVNDEARQSEAAFNAAIEGSGADGVLIVQLLGVDTHTQITTTMVPSSALGWGWGWGWGRGPGFGPTWVPAQQVVQYDIARVETNLYEARSRRLIWAASTDTFNPTSVARETPGFADLIIRELRTRGLIAGAK
jgi:hypothetical protein